MAAPDEVVLSRSILLLVIDRPSLDPARELIVGMEIDEEFVDNQSRLLGHDLYEWYTVFVKNEERDAECPIWIVGTPLFLICIEIQSPWQKSKGVSVADELGKRRNGVLVLAGTVNADVS